MTYSIFSEAKKNDIETKNDIAKHESEIFAFFLVSSSFSLLTYRTKK